jgi:polynucleotide 5'-kinase involved in rRNA processing
LVSQAIEMAPDDLVVQLFPYRPLPLLRHVTVLIAQLLRPTEILVAKGTDLEQSGFPVGPSEVEIESAFPPLVQIAQRKAQWLRLFEGCQKHGFDLRKVSIEGVRLGTGTRLTNEERQKAQLKDVVYAERAGGTLFAVTDVDVEESDVASALDFTGCTRAQFVAPGLYRNLLCSFAKQSGEDFGMGILTDIDWESLRAYALSTAIPPAPIRILRIGALRVDSNGRELGEVRPWQV